MRVLIVEDDIMIGDAMLVALKAEAYAVDWVRSGLVALTAQQSQAYDVILLDLGLPDKDGQLVLKTIRNTNPSIAIIIITARDMLTDKLQGLDSGADDYIVKPFDMAELLARMKAVLRRKAGSAAPVLDNGKMYLNLDTKIVTYKEKNVSLTAKEFALLRVFLIRPGVIFSRAELEDKIYGWQQEVESNAVEYLIYSLRKKLDNDAIENIRGLGWMVSKGV